MCVLAKINRVKQQKEENDLFDNINRIIILYIV